MHANPVFINVGGCWRSEATFTWSKMFYARVHTEPLFVSSLLDERGPVPPPRHSHWAILSTCQLRVGWWRCKKKMDNAALSKSNTFLSCDGFKLTPPLPRLAIQTCATFGLWVVMWVWVTLTGWFYCSKAVLMTVAMVALMLVAMRCCLVCAQSPLAPSCSISLNFSIRFISPPIGLCWKEFQQEWSCVLWCVFFVFFSWNGHRRFGC